MRSLTSPPISYDTYGAIEARLQSIDWSQTPLGPFDTWPNSLRSTLNILLYTQQPMCVFWGAQYVMLYNESFGRMFCEASPALGQPAEQACPELWGMLGSHVAQVATSSQAIEPFERDIVLRRSERLEQRWFTSISSPVYDEQHRVVGVLCIINDTTERQAYKRHQQALRGLPRALSRSHNIAEACDCLLSCLAASRDVAFAVLYQVDQVHQQAHLLGAHALPLDTPICQHEIDFTSPEIGHWPLVGVVQSGIAQEIPDLSAHFGSHAPSTWPESARSAVVLPIMHNDNCSGVLIVGLNPQVPPDVDVRFFLEQVAGYASSAFARIYASEQQQDNYQAELQAHRRAEHAVLRTSHLQELTAALAEARNPEEVAQVMIFQGLSVLGASAGMILLLTEPNTLKVLSVFGFPEHQFQQWQTIQADSVAPIADALQQAQPIWICSPEQRQELYPNVTPLNPQDQAWAILPLQVKGNLLGLICLSFAEPHTFEPNEQAFMMMLAQQCAQALEHMRLYVESEAALNARNDLFSSVSHDLKNPLSTIKGFAQLLRRRISQLNVSGTERLLDGLNKIDEASERMNKQISELVDTARLQADQALDFDMHEVELVQFLQHLTQEYQQTTNRHQLQFQTELTELVGIYDPIRIERVFANLLRNAIKYSPNGGTIQIELGRVQDKQQTWAQIKVSDQGIGIPVEDLPHIFERFRRAGNAAGHIQGTGIGLSSARQIVEQHHGTIDVDSIEGLGSCFIVRLPLKSS